MQIYRVVHTVAAHLGGGVFRRVNLSVRQEYPCADVGLKISKPAVAPPISSRKVIGCPALGHF